MSKYKLKFKVIQALSLCLLLFCCFCESPFATREPEKPVSKQSSWIQPTSPNYVMANLRNAVLEKNISNYLRCLADTSNSPKSFRFIADPAIVNQNPGLFDNWNKENELIYLNQLMLYLPKDSSSVFTIISSREDTYQDSVILIQEYSLEMRYKCDDQDCPRDMQGQAEFRLVRTPEDLWYIHRWSDIATGDEPSWSSLKAKFGK